MPTSDVVPEPDAAAAPSESPSEGPAGIWWTRRAIGLHVTVVVVVPTFLGLFWWQVQRVREGNTLSWAYVFEWPFFTGYAVYLWWKLVHDQPAQASVAPAVRPASASAPTPAGARGPGGEVSDREDGRADGTLGADGTPGADEDGDEELAAYNRYLAALHTSGRRKRW